MRGTPLPLQWMSAVTAPTLVIDGGGTPWLTRAAQATAQALPNAQRHTLHGQSHGVDPAVIAPVLLAFFDGGAPSV